jgi:hypothetical protein
VNTRRLQLLLLLLLPTTTTKNNGIDVLLLRLLPRHRVDCGAAVILKIHDRDAGIGA